MGPEDWGMKLAVLVVDVEAVAVLDGLDVLDLLLPGFLTPGWDSLMSGFCL